MHHLTPLVPLSPAFGGIFNLLRRGVHPEGIHPEGEREGEVKNVGYTHTMSISDI
jgi:hypothetical protein